MALDQDLFRQLARISIAAKKATGQSIDLTRMTQDPAYAMQTLSVLEQSSDEELIVLALSLKSQLGLLGAPSQPPKPAEAVKDKTPPGDDKYKFGARGG